MIQTRSGAKTFFAPIDNDGKLAGDWIPLECSEVTIYTPSPDTGPVTVSKVYAYNFTSKLDRRYHGPKLPRKMKKKLHGKQMTRKQFRAWVHDLCEPWGYIVSPMNKTQWAEI